MSLKYKLGLTAEGLEHKWCNETYPFEHKWRNRTNPFDRKWQIIKRGFIPLGAQVA